VQDQALAFRERLPRVKLTHYREPALLVRPVRLRRGLQTPEDRFAYLDRAGR